MQLQLSTSLLYRIRLNIAVVITGLIISGITAFPLETELLLLLKHSSALPAAMQNWIATVAKALVTTSQHYPFLNYGTDWLAFAHLILAILFAGPLKDPVRNIWVIQFGIIASILTFPLAFIAGSIRGIPVFWQMIDCSFGIIAIIPLSVACYYTLLLQKTNPYN